MFREAKYGCVRQAGISALCLNCSFSPNMPERHHFSAWFRPTPGLDYLTANFTDVSFPLFHSDEVAAGLGAMTPARAGHALCQRWGDPLPGSAPGILLAPFFAPL